MNIASDLSKRLNMRERYNKESAPMSITSTNRAHTEVGKPMCLLREILFIGIVCSAQLMTQAGLAISIAPLDIIGNSFGLKNSRELSWLTAAFSLTAGTFILVAGRLGDIYGHKKLFLIGFVWYALWSILAGFSVYSNHIFLFFCRALQGIGPALLVPNALAILGRTYEPGRRKQMIFSIFGATAPGGFVIGATFSSLFSQLVWWPWSYWVMGMSCLVLATAGLFVIPSSPEPSEDLNDKLSRIDIPGCITGVTGLVLLNFAWNQGAAANWSKPYVYVLLIIGVLFLAALALIESRAKFPLLPLSALPRDTAFILGCIAAGWSSFGIWLFYIWRFMIELRDQTPLLCSAQFTPAAISGLCAAITTGYLLSRVPPSFIMLVSMTAFAVGNILAATTPIHQSYWAQIFVAIAIMPWGMDMSFPAATILLSNGMPHEHQGLAASLVNTVVNYSISIGLGLAGTVESQINTGTNNNLKGYRAAWYMGIGLSGLGIFIALLYVISNFKPKETARLPKGC